MLCDIPSSQFRVFSGQAPLGQALASGFVAQTALVHADAHTPELSELIEDLARSTAGGFVFGGLASSRTEAVQFARGGERTPPATGRGHGVYSGGLSGVAFAPEVQMLTRVTQGCKPLGEVREITEANDHVIYKLDGAPALYALMHDLNVPIDDPRSAVDKVRQTLVGLSLPHTPTLRPTGGLDDAVMVRHIIGLDPVRHGVAVAHLVEPGMHLAFCQRDAKAAKADLLRIATEIRESLEPEEVSLEAIGAPDLRNLVSQAGQRIAGAIYVSCTGRGGPHFGAPSAELQIIQRALGDVPLVGFFAAGEIANQQVYGYTGVLTVFTVD
jgi:small ligand-binding sensory domain FIST